MPFCPTDHANRETGVDASDLYFDSCTDCGATWAISHWSAERAAVFRTAIACGRSVVTAVAMARAYDGRRYVALGYSRASSRAVRS